MRLVFRKYSDGSIAVVQTENDGSNPHALEDTRKQADGVRRIVATIDASFDENHDGAGGAKEGLQTLVAKIPSGLLGGRKARNGSKSRRPIGSPGNRRHRRG